MEFGIPYIYRRIATFGELEYYIDAYSKPEEEYKMYNIIFFCFHGETHTIHFEGSGAHLEAVDIDIDDEAVQIGVDISLEDLAERGPKFFRNRFVHFSSCRTLLGSEKLLSNFLAKTRAKVISGYTKSVDSSLAAIHDTALLREYVSRKQLPGIFRQMNTLYAGLEKELGFTTYPKFI